MPQEPPAIRAVFLRSGYCIVRLSGGFVFDFVFRSNTKRKWGDHHRQNIDGFDHRIDGSARSRLHSRFRLARRTTADGMGARRKLNRRRACRCLAYLPFTAVFTSLQHMVRRLASNGAQ
jgi:hypothetical protein